MNSPETHRAIEAVWRIESARIIAALTRLTGDIGVAEDLAQDAFVAALEKWPTDGIPDRPGAWLMAAAKHRAIDHLRRGQRLERKHDELGRELEVDREMAEPDLDEAIDDPIGDDLLRLIFICCHPVLPTESRVALTLRMVGGLTTEEIARCSWSRSPPRPADRAPSARLEAAPRGPRADMAARLGSVLEVIYPIQRRLRGDGRRRLGPPALATTRSASAGSCWLAPDEPGMARRADGIQASGAGVVSCRRAVLLDQDRSRDRLLIRRGLARARARARTPRNRP